jgi:hypothetical protein
MSKKGNYNDSRKTSSLDALFVMLDVLFMEKLLFSIFLQKKRLLCCNLNIQGENVQRTLTAIFGTMEIQKYNEKNRSKYRLRFKVKVQLKTVINN